MDQPPPIPTPAVPGPRPGRWALAGLLLGALLAGGYGAWDGWATYHSRERQEREIRSALERPHPDGLKFYARVYAVRYAPLESLAGRRGLVGGLVGGGVGGFAGFVTAAVVRERRARRAGLAAPPPRFTPVEFLGVLGLVVAGLGVLAPGPSGLVYHQGKDQTQWLGQLHSEDPAARGEAVGAVCHLLDTERYHCRAATIERLGKMGPEACPALPVLRRLADREPELGGLCETAIRQIERHEPKPDP